MVKRLFWERKMENSFFKSFSDTFYDEKLASLQTYLQGGKACILGAMKDGVLNGFLWGYPMDSLEGQKFHIAYIAVLPEGRGAGVGRELLRAAEEWAEELKISKMELIVSEQNRSAVQFYQGQDYGTHRLIMEKRLDEE